MYKQAISEPTQRVLAKVGGSFGADFYLAGGTALAIQLGHRLSIDLDWFSKAAFSNDAVKEKISQLGQFELISENKNTIHGMLDDVRVSFLSYRYPLLFPLLVFEGINLADERDIAAMKIDAISSRGSKKDFVDLYFLLEKYSLNELMGFFEKKYAGIKFNKLHVLKSLVYFEDAEAEPMPTMIIPVKWGLVKNKIMAEVNNLVE